MAQPHETTGYVQEVPKEPAAAAGPEYSVARDRPRRAPKPVKRFHEEVFEDEPDRGDDEGSDVAEIDSSSDEDDDGEDLVDFIADDDDVAEDEPAGPEEPAAAEPVIDADAAEELTDDDSDSGEVPVESDSDGVPLEDDEDDEEIVLRPPTPPKKRAKPDA